MKRKPIKKAKSKKAIRVLTTACGLGLASYGGYTLLEPVLAPVITQTTAFMTNLNHTNNTTNDISSNATNEAADTNQPTNSETPTPSDPVQPPSSEPVSTLSNQAAQDLALAFVGYGQVRTVQAVTGTDGLMFTVDIHHDGVSYLVDIHGETGNVLRLERQVSDLPPDHLADTFDSDPVAPAQINPSTELPIMPEQIAPIMPALPVVMPEPTPPVMPQS